LLAKKEEKTIQGNQVDYLRKIFFTSELSDRNKQNGSPERSKEMWVSLPSQMPNEDKKMMNERWKAGRSEGKILSLSERVQDFNKILLIYTSTGRLMLTIFYSAGSLVLPGEVEQTVTYCTPVFDKPIQMKFRNLSVPQPLDSKPQELLGDDVQPFSLDEEFDYDNVAVTPKFSEAELKAIKELSKEKKMG
ncbi:Uncharacterized protein C11orf74, partial [Manacus vitellinus]